MTKVDSAISFFERRWKWLLFLSIIVLAVVWHYQNDLRFIADLPIVKLLGAVLGPPVALAGFYLGYRSKREMVGLHQDAITKIGAETRAAGELKSQLDAKDAELKRTQSELEGKRQQLERERKRVERLDANLRRVAHGGQDLWKASEPTPFPEYYPWLRDPQGAKILAIGNLKGGVGKTTIAANLAGYISTKREKPVLLVDLDYQGSLSNMMLFGEGLAEVPSNVDSLFTKEATLETFDRATIHLHRSMSQGWIVPASYTFGSTESQLLLEWLMEPDQEIDARYRLARLLLNPTVRRKYSVIILDMPPRLTLGAVNALVTSHYFMVPSLLDRLSAEALRQFLATSQSVATDMKLDLQLLGTAGVLAREMDLSDREKLNWEQIAESSRIWGDKDFRIPRTIPIKSGIGDAAGFELAYKANKQNVRAIFDEFGDQVWERLFPAPALSVFQPAEQPTVDIEQVLLPPPQT